MWFSTFILKNLSRRPMRSSLTVIAIAIAIGAVVSLVGIARGFEESFLELYSKLNIDLMVVSSGGGKRKIQRDLPESWKNEISKLDGVAEVIPGLVDTVTFEELGASMVVINGWEPETLAFKHLQLLDGRMLTKADKNVVMLGTILASNMGKKVGDTFDLVQNESVTVVGIYKSFNVYDNGAIVIPMSEAQRILDRANLVTGYSIVLTPEAKKTKSGVDQMRKEIESLILKLQIIARMDKIRKDLAQSELAPAIKARMGKPWEEISEEIRHNGFTPATKERVKKTCDEIQQSGIDSSIKERIKKICAEALKLDENKAIQALSVREHLNSLVELKLAKAMAWLTSAIALVIGLFGMMNTMVMSVHERTREIGILRAVGWRPRRVLGMVLFEAVALSQVGAVVGILGSVVMLGLLTKVPMVNNLIDCRLNYGLAALGFVIASFVGLVGGSLPAIRAARLLPTAALRQE